MDNDTFNKMRRQLTILCIVYGIICEIASLFFIGFDVKFLAGLAMGIGIMLLNLILLKKTVEFYLEKKKLGLTIVLYLLRLLIYAGVAFICYKLSMNALMAYAIGAVGIVIGALVNFKKEVNKGV